MKKVSIGLLLICLFSLAACLWFHWKVESLEAEQEKFYQQIYDQQIGPSFDFSRGSEIEGQLRGRYGLYAYRRNSAVWAGVSGFAFLCVNLERLKQWLYQRQ